MSLSYADIVSTAAMLLSLGLLWVEWRRSSLEREESRPIVTAAVLPWDMPPGW